MARAPVLQIPNAAQLRLLWNINSALAVNVIGASHAGTVVFNQALAEALGSAIKAAFTTHLAARCSTACQLVRVGIRSLSSPNLQEWRDTGAAVAGSAVGDPLPGSVACCVTVRTGRSGKSYRGRVFLPGWSEAENLATGASATGTGTAAVAFMQAVNSALQTQNLSAAVLTRPAYASEVSRTTHLADGTDEVEVLSRVTAKPGGFTNATSFESRTLAWESQRRRINGRGIPPALVDYVASLPASPRAD